MRYKKIILLFCLFCVCAFLVYLLMQIEEAEQKKRSLNTPVELPYTWEGNISKAQIAEPSGITYHPKRKTLFVVDDGGFIHEIRPDGTDIQSKNLQERDLEGVTTNPATGLIYAVVEDNESILEINPETLTIDREFIINRTFEDKILLKKGGMGVEGIVFVPDSSHKEGGTFWIGNQSDSLKPDDEPSIVCEVVVPLNSSKTKVSEGNIVRYLQMDFVDISGLSYDTQSDYLMVISDTTNLLVEMKLDGNQLHHYLLPGNDQEGVTIDGLGYMYIAQESGQIIKFADKRLR